MEKYLITREIAIDAGHRLPKHDGKCRNMHGHRYRIQAVCVGELSEKGASDGMVLDFGFLKDVMIEQIDQKCDHAFILSIHDNMLMSTLFDDNQRHEIKQKVSVDSCWSGKNSQEMQLYVVDFMPTAENLARHWFELLQPIVQTKTNRKAQLAKIVVWETPNCSAQYPA